MFGRKKSVTGNRDVAVSQEDQASGPSTDGPHDRSLVSDHAAYYGELSFGHIDLGAMAIGVPQGRELNVALDPNGQPEFHVVTAISRVIPRVFAAPKTAGQWRNMVTTMSEQLETQGAEVSIVDGPWGRELVAEMPGAVFRAIGVDGDRWTAEVRIMATPENVDAAADEGREVFKHLLVQRGVEPMPAGEQLPLTIPDEIQQALEQARTQAAAQQQAQAYQQQMAAAGGVQNPTPEVQQQAQARASAPQPASPQEPVQEPAVPESPAVPRRDGSAMDRLRTSDDI